MDADFFLDPLDPILFPGVTETVRVHGGFQEAHSRSALQILTAAKTMMDTHEVKNILVVGHSLGGAIALLDGVYLGIHLAGTGVRIKVVTFGMPRVCL